MIKNAATWRRAKPITATTDVPDVLLHRVGLLGVQYLAEAEQRIMERDGPPNSKLTAKGR